MKIVFAGGSSGGHFYPIIAVAEAIHSITREQHLLPPKLYFVGPKAYDQEALFDNDILFVPCPAGKMRRYFSLENFTDFFVTLTGVLSALITLTRILPDVVFSKGSYASVPVVFAAKILGIPVMIHESDVHPGRANIFASSFAYRIATAFEATAEFFPPKTRGKIARTGIPIRKELATLETADYKSELSLEENIPTILILGGSSGAERINDVVLASLLGLTSFANVIHQTGEKLFTNAAQTAKLVLEKSQNALRYHAYPFLNALQLRRSASSADIIVSRAGMTAVAEIALWKKPSILIPIPESISHDQKTNAYAYAKTGASEVIEESNLNATILVSEIKRILGDEAVRTQMIEKSVLFANGDAARIVGEELVRISLLHEEK